ncbi:hypothetical protein V1639_09385 [Pseudarthrobacter sp. J75]|uniref:hypothetical protein n=1 Tax=unclassified Pseudarthrobacter TaxID=2647000 RepID=UPI002E814D06|nr:MULTISPECIES: hypothetical protein [unclassified Pseudarthrobacter]MEE2522431.1 hypothetical protein [Pseudarthrobacter sp. J47]MEE2529238.1 hypothetical protein [Pseudarthrobacter sp. J75]
MNMSHSALVVPAALNHPVHIILVELGTGPILRHIHGDSGRLFGIDWCVYPINGDSRATLPNVRAEVLIREAGIDLDEVVYGSAAFLGIGITGRESDVPRHLIRLAEQLFDMPLAA